MDSQYIFELQALLKLMAKSEAIKAMDPVVRYALYMQLQNPNPKLIKELNKILAEEGSGYQKIETKFQNDVEKMLETYKYNLNHAEFEVKKKKLQKATKSDQKKAEELLKSIK